MAMKLPTIGIPTYETTIPSTEEQVKFRPFLVKEEKILLLALESGDKKGQYRAIKEILKNCILSDINIDNLTVFDIEFMFIQIRGKSVGEVLEPVISCPKCGSQGRFKIDLSDININNENKVQTPYRVMLSDNVGITLVYPNMKMVEKVDPDAAISGGDTDTVFRIIVQCIDSIFDQENSYNPSDYSEADLIGFVESAPTENFKKIVEFISNMPRVEKKLAFRCPYCSHSQEMLLKGVEDFFGSASPTTA